MRKWYVYEIEQFDDIAIAVLLILIQAFVNLDSRMDEKNGVECRSTGWSNKKHSCTISIFVEKVGLQRYPQQIAKNVGDIIEMLCAKNLDDIIFRSYITELGI